MTLTDDLAAAIGAAHVLTGADLARYRAEWSGHYSPDPCAVARPGTTAEVAEVLRIAARHGVGVVPVTRYALSAGAGHEHEIILGYAHLSLEEISKGIALLHSVIAGRGQCCPT